MQWIVFALLTALALSTADALSKKAMVETDEYVIAWVREGYAIPFLAMTFLFIPIPKLDATFWLTLLILLPLEITAIILYIKSINLSPLSLTVPFIALSPVFILFIAFVLLGEVPGIHGVSGILLIVTGAYFLNVDLSSKGILEPIKAIGREKGVTLMILVALIYSITSTLGKVAVRHSSPVFFGFFYPFVLTAILTPIVWHRGKKHLILSRPLMFSTIGLCSAVMIASHFIALSLTNVAYMISVKRTSIVFSVIYGRLLFSEREIKKRLIGSTVMAAGVVMIVLD